MIQRAREGKDRNPIVDQNQDMRLGVVDKTPDLLARVHRRIPSVLTHKAPHPLGGWRRYYHFSWGWGRNEVRNALG